MQSALKNVKKNTVFSHFLCYVVQKAQKTLFFRISCELCSKCLEKRTKKHCFLTPFVGRRAKSSKNAVISHFFANFLQSVSKNVKKTLFSHTFCGTSCKKLKKPSFFRIFLRTLYKVSRKTWKKHCFFILFVGRRAKSSKNPVFFRIFCELCTKCLEKREKPCFLTVFVGRRAKSSKKRSFSHFLRTLYKVTRKTWKNTVFSQFLRDVVLKAHKTLFFAFFANFLQSASKNVKIILSSHFFFRGASCKKLKKPCYVAFLWNLYKVPRKTWKNTVFSHFLWDVVQKAQKFFRIFCKLCTKCLKKREKTLFSHTFCGKSCKKHKKRCFSHFLQNLYKMSRKTLKKHCFLTFFVGRLAKSSK